MQGRALLRSEIIKWVYKRSPSRATLIGEFAKAPNKRQHNPAWMEIPFFDGESWFYLGVYKRKYVLRTTVRSMLDEGVLRAVHYQMSGYKQHGHRLEVGSVLDLLSAIGPAAG